MVNLTPNAGRARRALEIHYQWKLSDFDGLWHYRVRPMPVSSRSPHARSYTRYVFRLMACFEAWAGRRRGQTGTEREGMLWVKRRWHGSLNSALLPVKISPYTPCVRYTAHAASMPHGRLSRLRTAELAISDGLFGLASLSYAATKQQQRQRHVTARLNYNSNGR